jgi:hypothetical protein
MAIWLAMVVLGRAGICDPWRLLTSCLVRNRPPRLSNAPASLPCGRIACLVLDGAAHFNPGFGCLLLRCFLCSRQNQLKFVWVRQSFAA